MAGTEIYAGWLFKQGAQRKAWKKRYFKLTDTVLSYGPNASTVKGHIPVSSIAEIAAGIPPTSTKKIKWSKGVQPFVGNVFYIATPARTYIVVPETQAELRDWLRVIRTQRQVAQADTAYVPSSGFAMQPSSAQHDSDSSSGESPSLAATPAPAAPKFVPAPAPAPAPAVPPPGPSAVLTPGALARQQADLAAVTARLAQPIPEPAVHVPVHGSHGQDKAEKPKLKPKHARLACFNVFAFCVVTLLGAGIFAGGCFALRYKSQFASLLNGADSIYIGIATGAGLTLLGVLGVAVSPARRWRRKRKLGLAVVFLALLAMLVVEIAGTVLLLDAAGSMSSLGKSSVEQVPGASSAEQKLNDFIERTYDTCCKDYAKNSGMEECAWVPDSCLQSCKDADTMPVFVDWRKAVLGQVQGKALIIGGAWVGFLLVQVLALLCTFTLLTEKDFWKCCKRKQKQHANSFDASDPSTARAGAAYQYYEMGA